MYLHKDRSMVEITNSNAYEFMDWDNGFADDSYYAFVPPGSFNKLAPQVNIVPLVKNF